MIVVDFETVAINGNTTVHPPQPVGVSIYRPGKDKPKYWAWGHPSENNCTFEDAKRQIGLVCTSGEDLLFHNAKFDLAIIEQHFRMRVDPMRVFDTMYDIFFTDPYSPNLGLKSSAERLLGVPPDEANALRDWIVANVSEARQRPSEWGAYIACAPAGIVGEYANGDVLRTWQLFEKQHPIVNTKGMMAAYHREQRLLPILMRSERRGIRVDTQQLGRDVDRYSAALNRADNALRAHLGADDLNIDSNEDLADALDAAGMVGAWQLTATGRRSTAKKALDAMVAHPGVLALLRYRGALQTCLSTFAVPWYERAMAGDGRIHTNWNQVRSPRGDKDSKGARTGRLSSNDPSFMNIPNDFEGLVVPAGYPEMIHLRQYLLPEEGHVWLKRDFASQEMRVAAHYAEGKLHAAYNADPNTDPHNFVKAVIKELMQLDLPRRHVKITGFQILYGGGANAVAGQLGCAYDEGAALKKTYFAAMPEMEKLSNGTRNRGRNGGFIRTWGGRIYYAEPPKLDKKTKQYREYSYKLLNYLIQGSAADLTKQAIIDWDGVRGKDDVFLATVHDELDISAPEDSWEDSMATLRGAMNKMHLEVPMVSDGEVGRNWQDLENCE